VDTIDLLQNPAYRHMLLNHVPIIGLFMALVVLSAGLLARQASLLFTGLALVALTAGASIPVARYGDAAYPAIYDTLDGYGRDWLDYHAALAETWLPLLYANAALALVALIVCIARPRLLQWAGALVALVTLAGLVGATVVARAGGKIQHPEFRLADPPVLSSSVHRRG
jgi:hypothetical protein